MKKCPFCAELIQDEAIKCRHCSEFLDGSSIAERKEAQRSVEQGDKVTPLPKVKWHHSTFGIITALCCAGPFALPLVWTNPRLSNTKKIVITIVVAILTILACKLVYYSICNIIKLYKQIPTL